MDTDWRLFKRAERIISRLRRLATEDVSSAYTCRGIIAMIDYNAPDGMREIEELQKFLKEKQNILEWFKEKYPNKENAVVLCQIYDADAVKFLISPAVIRESLEKTIDEAKEELSAFGFEILEEV